MYLNGTHLPLLHEATKRIPVGSVLELGVGEYSTPFLNEVAKPDRLVFSFDNNEKYFKQFEHFRNQNHFIAKLNSWSECPIESSLWSIAFVDHSPVEKRGIEIGRLLYRALVVIVHDTNQTEHGYEDRFQWYRYRFDHDYIGGPKTTAVSNYIDVSKWTIGNG